MPPAESTRTGIHPDASVRNAGIDLLRGLAIVLVVFNHLGLRIPLKQTALADVLPAWLLSRLNYNGYEAVFVFFVISGFLIAGNALRRWGRLERIDMRAFYARRFARIVPCLLALVAVLSVLHLVGVRDYTIIHANQSLPRAIVAALGLHLNWYEGQTGYLPGSWDVLWSLSIEEVFYIGFPLLCLLTRRRAVLLPMLVLLALSMPWTHAALRGNEIWQEKAYQPGMAAIAVGVLGAVLASHWPAPPRRTGILLGWLGAIGLAAVMLDGAVLWHLLRDGYLLVLALSTLCLLLASQQRQLRGNWRPVRGWLAALMGSPELRDLPQPHVRGVRGGALVPVGRRRPALGFPVVSAGATAVLAAWHGSGALAVAAMRTLVACEAVACTTSRGNSLAGDGGDGLTPMRSRRLRMDSAAVAVSSLGVGRLSKPIRHRRTAMPARSSRRRSALRAGGRPCR
jgi:peptidoglycan/LPS O-acetylase OafA/YrhL